MINMRLLIFIALIICFTECKKNANSQVYNNNLFKKASIYFNENIDSLYKHFIFYDSNVITTIGLSFYYYSDHRDNPIYWKKGVVVIDKTVGNSYFFSKKLPGYPLESHTIIELFEPPFFPKEIFIKDYSNRPFDSYGLTHYSEALKLSSILNNLTLRQRELLNRNILDSCFRFFLFDPNELKGNNVIKISQNQSEFDDNIHDEIKHAGLNKIQEVRLENIERLNSFQTFVNNNFDNDNFFLYSKYNHYWLVTVNETFVNDTKVKKYYKMLTNEYSLYSIHVYDVSSGGINNIIDNQKVNESK